MTLDNCNYRIAGLGGVLPFIAGAAVGTAFCGCGRRPFGGGCQCTNVYCNQGSSDFQGGYPFYYPPRPIYYPSGYYSYGNYGYGASSGFRNKQVCPFYPKYCKNSPYCYYNGDPYYQAIDCKKC